MDTNGKIVVAANLDLAIDAVNIIAPEHLEICLDDPFAVLSRIKNAGSIFMGRNVPEALGDYFGRPQPHAAHQRHRPLLQPSERG